MQNNFERGSDPERDRRISLLCAAGGFILLSCGDVITKSAAQLWPGSALAALRYSFGAIGLAALLFLRGGSAAFVMPRPWIQVGRGAAVALSTLCFFAGLQFMPIATATAIGFTAPMMTALLSALLLREKLPRILFIVLPLAFAGVVLVLRPGLASVGAFALFPVGSAFGMALLMMLNRVGAGSATPLVMQMLVAAWAAPMLVAAAFLLHLTGNPAFHAGYPDWRVIAGAAGVAVIASAAHWLIYLGTLKASPAVVAPTSYVQMLFAVTFGWVVFGDVPDGYAALGIALIVMAGLLLFGLNRPGDR